MIKFYVIICVLMFSFSIETFAAKKCDDVADGEPTTEEMVEEVVEGAHGEYFDLASKKPHYARTYGDQLNLTRVKAMLSKLTGETAIDSEGCIRGRCSEEQRQRTRNFLVEVFESLGLEPRVEEFVYRVEREKPEPEIGENLDEDVLLIDFKAMGKEELAEFNNHYLFADILDWLRTVEGVGKSPEALKSISIKKLQAIVKKVEKLKEGMPEYEAAVEEGVNLNYVVMDARRIIAGMKAANKLKAESNNKKTVKKPNKKKPKKIEHKAYNVIVEIPGNDKADEIVEVNAHYDTTGSKKPGADDNGSGVATLIELAYIFAQSNPERTIRLVVSDLEEIGFIGTTKHVENAYENEDYIVAVLVVDTIGYAPLRSTSDTLPEFVVELGVEGDHYDRGTYSGAKDVAEVLKYQFDRYKDRNTTLEIAQESALPGTADHGPYWEYGYPAVLIAAPYEGDKINPGYHKTTDVMAQYNWGYFESISRFVVESVALLASPEATRTRRSRDETNYLNEVLNKDVKPDVSRIEEYTPPPPPPPVEKKKKYETNSRIGGALHHGNNAPVGGGHPLLSSNTNQPKNSNIITEKDSTQLLPRSFADRFLDVFGKSED